MEGEIQPRKENGKSEQEILSLKKETERQN